MFSSLLVLWYVSGSGAGRDELDQPDLTEESRSWLMRQAVSYGLAFCIAAGLIGAGTGR